MSHCQPAHLACLTLQCPHILPATGPHTLTITKLTDPHYGAAWIKNITIDEGGRFLPPPPTPGMQSGRRILFLGDSLT